MIFNPLDKFYKSVTGPICETQTLNIRVRGDFAFVYLVINNDDNYLKKVALQNKGDFFECALTLPVGLYFYYFETNKGFISNNVDYVGELSEQINAFQLSVYSKDYKVPGWLSGGIIYQIFPDRFNVGVKDKKVAEDKVLHSDLSDTPVFLPNNQGEVLNNDFFGGDLKGITDKLDYLRTLNVTAIYLNPIFKAYSNHRYDTGDYFEIDELLGDKSDLILLIDKAHEKGIKIILDGVFNHTGSDSLYFNKKGKYQSLGAYQSEKSPYYNWFNFINYPNLYESWWGIQTLPSVNKTNGEFMNFITGKDGVLEHYIALGIDGFRLDVVDELPSEFVKNIRKAIKGVNEQAIIIGEVWEDASNKIAYDVRREYFLGKELDSVMNYPLKNSIIDFVNNGNSKQLSNVIKTQIDHYPQQVINCLMNFLSTHDTFRIISAISGIDVCGKSKTEMSDIILSNKQKSQLLSKIKMATLLQYTLFGAVSIYYGDELGMDGFSDPLNRKFMRWQDVGNEFYKWHVKLGEIRKDYNNVINGDFTELYSENGAFVYKRSFDGQELLIAINNGEKEIRIKYSGTLLEILSEKEYINGITLEKGDIGIYKNIK